MHVGYAVSFQNPAEYKSDREVYATEISLIDAAVEYGFESIWVVEHHFTDYFLSPDPIQFLTWCAARYPDIRLGTGVIVLPWHDPVRCAEQITMLDNLSDGRMILGIGRGLGKIEYDGFRVDMNTSRERFVEYAELILGGLESGTLEADGEFITLPPREIRPRPVHSFHGRTYAASMSPEAMPIMARLGVGVLVVPQKEWTAVAEDLGTYRATWADHHGPDVPAPAPLCAGNIVLHSDPAVAEELAHRYIGGYYHSVIEHYGFNERAHAGVRGYEFYAGIGKHVERRGLDGAAADYVNLMPWGTPDQVLEKLSTLRDLLGMAAFNPSFNFADMPPEVAHDSLSLFAREVLPVLKEWRTEELAEVRPREAATAGA